jgi:hypothetical protein
MSLDNKDPETYEAAADGSGSDHGVDEKRGNAADRADMYRMGKMQEMKVRESVCSVK